MSSIFLNELLKLLIVFSMCWSAFNLYLAIYWRIRSIKSHDFMAISKMRMRDFFEGLIFLFIFWTYIVAEVYLHGLGVLDSGFHQGKNIVCVGIKLKTFCLGREEAVDITLENQAFPD